ncbi:hypothetical protein NBRC116600_19050 [Thalassotalea sp. SU-HH00458]
MKKLGVKANKKEPNADIIKADNITGFSPYLSTSIPEGIDMTPYAAKNEKGRKPATAKLRSKSFTNEGNKGPKILVIKEMAKKMTKTKISAETFFVILFIIPINFLSSR